MTTKEISTDSKRTFRKISVDELLKLLRDQRLERFGIITDRNIFNEQQAPFSVQIYATRDQVPTEHLIIEGREGTILECSRFINGKN